MIKSNEQVKNQSSSAYSVETYEPLVLKPEESIQNKEYIINAFKETSPSQKSYNSDFQKNQNIQNYNNYLTTNNTQILYNQPINEKYIIDNFNTNFNQSYPIVQNSSENINYNYFQDINSVQQNPITYQDFNVNSTNFSYQIYGTPVNIGSNYNIQDISYQYTPQNTYTNADIFSPYSQSYYVQQSNVYTPSYGGGFNYTNIYF